MSFQIDEELWNFLEEKGSGDIHTVSYPVKGTSYQAYLFYGGDKGYHCSIKLESISSEKLLNPNAKGIVTRIYRDVFLGDTQTRSDLLDIACMKKKHLGVFSKLVTDILNSLIETNLHPVKSCNQIVKEHKSFWDKRSADALSFQEEIGLFAELKTLTYLIENFSPSKAIDSWKGPEGHKFDFDFFSSSIEVKATTLYEHEHKINGLNQLERKHNGQLYLVSSKLHQSDDTNGQNLTNFVKAIIELLKNDHIVYEKFIKKLGLTKYNENHKDEYSYFQESSMVFEVNEHFPIITTNSFKEDLPPQIPKVYYVLNLEGFEGASLDSKYLKTELNKVEIKDLE